MTPSGFQPKRAPLFTRNIVAKFNARLGPLKGKE